MAKNKPKKKRVKKHRKFWLGFKIVILLLLLTILFGGIFLYFKYGKDVFAMQDEAILLVQESTPETFRASETSIVYNSKGRQISILKGEKDTYYLAFDKIPQVVKDSVIVMEDRQFWDHNGIDAKGITRAVIELIKNQGEKKQGASTITQQLARGVFLSNEKTFERKIKEIFIALELEKKYTKEQIFEYYLNTIYYGDGYYGIEAAARGYFSKGCDELSLAQVCFLSAIPNNPTLYDPVDNYDNTIKRKNLILDTMLEQGVIDRVSYDEAYNEKIKLKRQEVKKRDYIQTFVNYCAIRKIMEVNGFKFKNSFTSDKEKNAYEEEYDEYYAIAQQMLLNNGYRIYTSIDLKKQKELQNAIDDNLDGFKEKADNGIYKMQGAAVCIDNKTGRVVAIVGGRSQKTEGYSLNRAFQSFRQPGSSIKPIIVYTPTIERGANANTTVHDHKFADGPSNSDGSYSGYISMRTAVEKSKNTVAWQLFEELTPEVGLDYLKQMNFSKIVSSDYYLPASLGGLTYGASALEMASAYATLENDGKYREPTCIVKILDSDGNVIVDDDVKEKFIYNADAANAMTDILQGVITRGTAVGLGLDDGMACAAKTGTTNDKKDGWFCGYSPYYTTAVWVGYDSPQTVSDLYGSTYPGRTWQMFMKAIHEGLKVKEDFGFTLPSGSSYKPSYSGESSETTTEKPDNVDKDPGDDVDVDEDDTAEPSPDTTQEPVVTQAPTPTPQPATPAPTEPPATPAPTPEPPTEEAGAEETATE